MQTSEASIEVFEVHVHLALSLCKGLHDSTPHSLVEKSKLEKTQKGRMGGSSWSSLRSILLSMKTRQCVFFLRRETTGSEKESQRRVEVTAESHNNLLTYCASF